jgi:hypothetical protein
MVLSEQHFDIVCCGGIPVAFQEGMVGARRYEA